MYSFRASFHGWSQLRERAEKEESEAYQNLLKETGHDLPINKYCIELLTNVKKEKLKEKYASSL